MARWFSGAAIFLTAAAVTVGFFLQFCNWLFNCGCRALWAGAATHCNIHHASPPHCPWCAIGNWYYLVFFAMIGAQAWYAFRPTMPWYSRLMLALAAFPTIGLVSGVIIGGWQGQLPFSR